MLPDIISDGPLKYHWLFLNFLLVNCKFRIFSLPVVSSTMSYTSHNCQPENGHHVDNFSNDPWKLAFYKIHSSDNVIWLIHISCIRPVIYFHWYATFQEHQIILPPNIPEALDSSVPSEKLTTCRIYLQPFIF